MREFTDTELAAAEGNIIDSLLEAAAYKSNMEQRKVTISRNGKKLFSFRITGLDEDTWRKCRRNNLRNKGKRNEELDGGRFLSSAIYEATVDEDKAIWNNHTVWEKLGAVTGADVVHAILLPGEKAKISEILEELSGYNDEIDDMIQSL